MAIIISTTPTSEALVYNRIFMTSISISQRLDNDSSKDPYYDLNIKYRIFATDSNGTRYFDNTVYSIDVPDYFSAASAQAALGNMEMVTGIKAIEAVIAKLIQDRGIHGNTSITP